MKYPRYVNKLAVMGAVLFPSEQSVGKKVLKEVRDELNKLKDLSDVSSKAKVR